MPTRIKTRAQEAYYRRALLREHRERPRRHRAGKKRDELAPRFEHAPALHPATFGAGSPGDGNLNCSDKARSGKGHKRMSSPNRSLVDAAMSNPLPQPTRMRPVVSLRCVSDDGSTVSITDVPQQKTQFLALSIARRKFIADHKKSA
jgi:hypothetical protein